MDRFPRSIHINGILGYSQQPIMHAAMMPYLMPASQSNNWLTADIKRYFMLKMSHANA